MDPNANLQEQEEILTRNAATVGPIPEDDRDRLRELRIALKQWLNAGGFAPTWYRYPQAARYFGHLGYLRMGYGRTTTTTGILILATLISACSGSPTSPTPLSTPNVTPTPRAPVCHQEPQPPVCGFELTLSGFVLVCHPQPDRTVCA